MSERIGWRALARYVAGESAPEEAAGVERWARSDPHHAEILDSARRAWAAVPRDASEPDVERAWKAVAARLQPPAKAPAPRRWVWGVAAAAAVVALVAIPVVRTRLNAPAGETRYATGPARELTVRLPDGSVVRLAPNTTLRARLNGTREVWLEGTAFFAVAKREGRAFTVHTSAGDARVLGTRFELRALDRHVRLAVLEGRVALSGARASEVVTAGEVSTVDAGQPPSPPQTADVTQLTGWMNGVLIFQATPLASVAIEMERQYGVTVRVDPALGDRTVNAIFDHQPLATVATSLCRIADATCEVQDSLVWIHP